MKHYKIKLSAALLLAVLFSYAAQAQDKANSATNNDDKSFIGITGGFSPVFGNYTKTAYMDDKSGFASAGMNIGITGVYFIKHHFGIAGLISYSGYGYQGSQNLTDGYKEAFDLDSATLYRKGNNDAFSILVGPYYSLPLGQSKLHLDVRILVGYVHAQFAGNEVYLEDGVGNQFEQQPANASAFGYQSGIGLRYDLCRHFGVGVNADYFGSTPDFKIDNTNRKNEAGWLRSEYKQPIQGINANLTLIYRM